MQTTQPDQITLTPAQVVDAITYCIKARRPPCLWGSPGIGKSQIMHQYAANDSRALIDCRLPLLDAVDLMGLPYVLNGRSAFATPSFLPVDGRGILFLDELNRATTMIQNAALQLVHDRKLGAYSLPDDWMVAIACNRESDGGGVQRMTSAMGNRVLHINVVPDVNDWCKWAVTAGVQPVVIAFIRWKPELLDGFDAKARAFPSPRSWHIVSDIVGTNPPDALLLALVAGAVGHGAAIEFLAFYKLYKSLPSIDAIMLNPKAAPVPKEVATLYAVSAALARRAQADNFGRVIQYLDRLPTEFNVMSVRDAVTRDATLQPTPEFTTWSIAHSDVVM
jgi:hypothetical protein